MNFIIILSILFQFVLKHIIQNYDSNICGKVVPYNYSLKNYRIFALNSLLSSMCMFDAYCLL